MVEEYCDECDSPMKRALDIKNTRLFVCPECFSQKASYVIGKICSHEYAEKNKDRCIHCGKQK